MSLSAQTLLSGETTLPHLLLTWSRKQPDALAFREKNLGIWRRLTWADYLQNAKDFAAGLEAIGFQPGDKLAIAGEGIPEWMYADLATQALGGLCVGLYPTSPWQELSFILRHSRAKMAVCSDQEQTDKVLDALENDGLPDLEWIVCVDPKGMRNYQHEKLTFFEDVLEKGRDSGSDAFERGVKALSPDQPAIIVYTSGTTGAPKGALLTHRNLLIASQSVLSAHEYTGANHETLCYLPLCHVAERSFSTVMQLCCGSVINFAESVDTVSSDLREIAPTIFLGVPRIWEKLQQTILIKLRESYGINQWIIDRTTRFAMRVARKEITLNEAPTLLERLSLWALRLFVFRNLRRFAGLHRCKACFCGAAAVSPEVLLFFRAIGLPIFQLYGMTETAAVAVQQVPGRNGFGSVGIPIPSMEVELGPDGELKMRGPSVFSGYLDAPDATEAAFTDGWLTSGDIAVVEDGEYRIVDRKKDLIVTSGGKNISPSEIEHALKESPYIREAIVIGDGRNFVSALLQIDHDVVAKWAQEKQLSFTTFRSLAVSEQVRELISTAVTTANGRFARVAHVRKFVLLEKELDHDDGELTATMKVRRKAIEEKYADHIGEIYGDPA